MTTEVPKRLSTAIRMAVWDMLKLEQQQDLYVFQGEAWHSASFDVGDEGKCGVCFAGCIMAGELGAKAFKSYGKASFGAEWSRVFGALDSVRLGFIQDAVLTMMGDMNVDMRQTVNRLVVAIFDDPEADERSMFREWAVGVADELQEVGL